MPKSRFSIASGGGGGARQLKGAGGAQGRVGAAQAVLSPVLVVIAEALRPRLRSTNDRCEAAARPRKPNDDTCNARRAISRMWEAAGRCPPATLLMQGPSRLGNLQTAYL